MASVKKLLNISMKYLVVSYYYNIVYPARKGTFDIKQGFWVRKWQYLKEICYTRVFDQN